MMIRSLGNHVIDFASRCVSVTVVSLAVLSSACADGDDSTYNRDPDVTVSYVQLHVTGQGEVEYIPDLSDTSISALVPDGAGAFRAMPAEPPVEGVFRIPNVPSGVYYLLATGSDSIDVVVTSKREIQLGGVYAGRPDEERIENPAHILLDVDGMAPWDDSHALILHCLEAGASMEIVVPSIAEGTVGLHDVLAEAYSWIGQAALIDGNRGDRVWLTQSTLRSTGSDEVFTYYAVQKSLSPEPFTYVNGQAAMVRGTFAAAPEQKLLLDWKRSLFAAAAREAYPSVELASMTILIDANTPPQGSNNMLSALLRLSDTGSWSADGSFVGPRYSDTTLDLGYGNPFPSDWPVVVRARITYSSQVDVPGSMVPQRVYGRLWSAAFNGMTDNILQPNVTPPIDLRVNGEAPHQTLHGIGTVPVVSWSPPLSGSPASYVVSVFRFDAMEQGFVSRATLRTDDTSITIPPGIFEEGSAYYMAITATTARERATNARAPFLGADSADALTGVLWP